MQTLFTIATDRARLSWSAPRSKTAAVHRADAEHCGVLDLRLLRRDARFESWRAYPLGAASHTGVRAGPPIFEQNEYRVALRALGTRDVTLEHRDPLILDRLEDEDRGRFDCLVNFRSQIGISTFRVLVDGAPEFEFDVEVFPTKLD